MKQLPRILAILICAMVAVTFLATPALAGDDQDPPNRVARLKYMSGQVSFQPGGVNDWVDATLNRPLTTADRVWTDKDSKAELHLGSAALRMSNETSLTLTNLSDNTVQVELDQGVLNLHVRKMYSGEVYEVDTPNVAFTLLKPGDYRFEVDPDRDTTTVIVRKGKGEGNGDGRGVEVESGEMARFEHGNTLMHAVERAPGLDGFDDWCRVRDQREYKGYESARYVSDDVIGYEDLDDNGYWRPVPTYGYVWVPRRVVAGWAPYRYGHWAWIEPWGWTWVDDAAWGFAPFHYGRWVYSSYGWAWCPGPRVYRPVYAPALVAWFGGPHFGVGISFGNVGWVPLGWGEPFYPYYRVSNVYVRNVNITNTHITNITYVTNNYTTIINNHGKPIPIHGGRYMNERGVSVVSNDAMIRSQRVDRAMQPWKGHDLKDAEFMHTPGVTPDRRSVLGSDREARVPQGVSDRRQVMSKLTPPERPSNFDDRRPYIEKNNGMPVDRNVGARGMRVPEDRKPVDVGEGPRGGRSDSPAVKPMPPGVRAPEERKPMDVGEGPRNGRDDNPTAKPSPSGVRVPEERKPMDVGERTNAPDSLRRPVPRPPSERQPMGGDVGSPAGRGASNDGSQRVVPRPPSERKPVDVGEDGRRAGNPDSKPQLTPRAPEERKPAGGDDSRNVGRRESNPQQVTPRAPEERKPAGEEGRGMRPAPEERRNTDAEVRRQDAPKPPEREVKPPAERRNEDRPAPKREDAPKPKPPEPKPSNAAPAGSMARGSGHYVPRPPMTASYRPSSFASSSGYSRNNVRRDVSDRPTSYTRRDYSSGSNIRDYGYSRRESPSYSSRGSYSAPRESRSAGYRAPSGYSGRSSASVSRQPSHAASGGSGSPRSSGGGSARHYGR